MTLTHEDLNTLRKPFAPSEHEFLKGMTYITEDAITTRIEDVDPAWTLDVLNISNRDNVVTCLVRLTINGVFRDGVGMNAITMTTDGKREANEAEKAAATDALKRAARLFGIGRYLLSLPSDVKDEATLARHLNSLGTRSVEPPAPASKGMSRATFIAKLGERGIKGDDDAIKAVLEDYDVLRFKGDYDRMLLELDKVLNHVASMKADNGAGVLLVS